MPKLSSILFGTAALFASAPSAGHHTYAMFDPSHTAVVSGTVAKLEWRNPHVYLWIYVANPQSGGAFDLYTFENASINVLARLGWSKTTLTAGDSISVTYYPLRDGRRGGHFIAGTLADGRTLRGAGGPGIHRRLP